MKNRMHLVQETLKFMVHQLKATDRLGLVLYDENVDTVLPLTRMDNEGKVGKISAWLSTSLQDIAFHVAKRLDIGGQTNCSGGLLRGLDMIRTRKE